MFANTQMMGVDIGGPDVCKTPPVAAPIPYPNIATGMMGVPAAYTILILCAPAHNLATTIPLSNGDNIGVMLGAVSQTVMFSVRHVTAAFTCLFTCMPATRMTSVTVSNTMNTPGVRVVPSQPKVLILSP